MGDSGLWGKRTMGRRCKCPVPYSYNSYSQAALTCEAEATQGRDGSLRGGLLTGSRVFLAASGFQAGKGRLGQAAFEL